MKSSRLTKEEDKFWESVYGQLVEWGIHEDFTYDICFMVVKAKFERLKGVARLV